jgi:hypothetical protein
MARRQVGKPKKHLKSVALGVVIPLRMRASRRRFSMEERFFLPEARRPATPGPAYLSPPATKLKRFSDWHVQLIFSRTEIHRNASMARFKDPAHCCRPRTGPDCDIDSE